MANAILGNVLDVSAVGAAGRTVAAYREDTWALIATVATSSDRGTEGDYSIDTGAYTGACTLVFSGEPDRNSLVLSGVIPVTV